MKSFKEYVDKRDLKEGIGSAIGSGLKWAGGVAKSGLQSLANSAAYRLNRFGAGPEQKAQADAIDNFGINYQHAMPAMTKSAENLKSLNVPMSQELEKNVIGVSKRFGNVVQAARNSEIPVRKGQYFYGDLEKYGPQNKIPKSKPQNQQQDDGGSFSGYT